MQKTYFGMEDKFCSFECDDLGPKITRGDIRGEKKP